VSGVYIIIGIETTTHYVNATVKILLKAYIKSSVVFTMQLAAPVLWAIFLLKPTR